MALQKGCKMGFLAGIELSIITECSRQCLVLMAKNILQAILSALA
jgi:hypothetical protein